MSPRRNGNSVSAREQSLLLRCWRLLQDRGEFRRQPRFHGQPPPNRPIAIFGRGQQRHPVVVEIADVLVGEVVDRLLQVALHPGRLRLSHRGEQSVLDQLSRRRVRGPVPELPETLDGLHPHRRHRVGDAFRQRRRRIPDDWRSPQNVARTRASRPIASGRPWIRARRSVRLTRSPDAGCTTGARSMRRSAAPSCWDRPAAGAAPRPARPTVPALLPRLAGSARQAMPRPVVSARACRPSLDPRCHRAAEALPPDRMTAVRALPTPTPSHVEPAGK